jgi:hypothetical protein
MRPKGFAGQPSVAIAEIGGVRIHRHVLEREAATLACTLRKLGVRIRYWLRATDEHKPLPDETLIASWNVWQSGILGLLKEQRERAKLTPKNGAAVLTDEEYQEALSDLVRQSLAAMPDDELEQLLAMRRKAAPIEVK